jgi:hypothetical protein
VMLMFYLTCIGKLPVHPPRTGLRTGVTPRPAVTCERWGAKLGAGEKAPSPLPLSLEGRGKGEGDPHAAPKGRKSRRDAARGPPAAAEDPG